MVSSDDWSTTTWLVPGACEDGGNRDSLRQHASAGCPAWLVRDVPARGESAGQSGRGTAGRLGKANRAFAVTSYSSSHRDIGDDGTVCLWPGSGRVPGLVVADLRLWLQCVSVLQGHVQLTRARGR